MSGQAPSEWEYQWSSPFDGSFMFIRTRWEPRQDGMSQPISELQAFMYFSHLTQVWRIYLRGHYGLNPPMENRSLTAATKQVEDYFYGETKSQAVYGG